MGMILMIHDVISVAELARDMSGVEYHYLTIIGVFKDRYSFKLTLSKPAPEESEYQQKSVKLRTP